MCNILVTASFQIVYKNVNCEGYKFYFIPCYGLNTYKYSTTDEFTLLKYFTELFLMSKVPREVSNLINFHHCSIPS